MSINLGTDHINWNREVSERGYFDRSERMGYKESFE